MGLDSRWPLLLLLVGYVAMMAYHAAQAQRRTRSLADYYVGGRSMSGAVLGLSFFATFCSTNGFVGLAGKSYTYGAPWLLYTPIFILAAWVSWRAIAPRFRELTEQLDSVTLPDFVGARYASPHARTLVAVLIIVASILYMTAIYKGMGNVLQIFLGISYETGVLMVLIITMAYTAVGGFKSVVRTDGVQGCLILLAAAVVAYRVIGEVSARTDLWQLRDAPQMQGLFAWDTAVPFGVMLGIMIAGAMKLLVEPRQLSRFYALRDRRAIQVGKRTSLTALALFFSLLLPVGMLAVNLELSLPASELRADTDLVIPSLLASAVFSPLEGALIALAIVAAAMSSLDSVLLVVASIFHRDLVGRWLRATRERPLLATRSYVVLLAIATATVALNPPGGIVEITTLSGSIYAACLTPVMLLGLHWHRGNGATVIVSATVGLSTLVIWRYSALSEGLHEIFPAVAASMVTYVAMALVMPPQPGAQKFFQARMM